MNLLDRFFNLSNLSRRFVIWFYSKKEGGVYRSHTLRKLYKRNRDIDAGYLSYGWTSDLIEGPVTIGKYVSIGKNVRRMDMYHFTNYVTTHPCVFNPIFGWVNNDPRQKSQLNIGNDVWIGENVIILPSCHNIGNGAIIAAGSVVTKDVPSYEIWGGVAAHILKKRFSDEIITKLEALQWWNYSEEELKERNNLFSNPDEFIRVINSLICANE